MLKPVTGLIAPQTFVFTGAGTFAAQLAQGTSAFSAAGAQMRAVSGDDGTSAVARRFAQSSQIYLADRAGSFGGSGFIGGAGAPPASGGRDDDCRDPKVGERVEWLIAKLKKRGDRIWAAEELGRIGPDAKAAIPALMRLLKSRDDEVRRAAAEGISGIDPSAGKLSWALKMLSHSSYSEYKDKAVDVLRGISRYAVPLLIAELGNQNATARENAAWAPGEIGRDAKRAVPELIRVLHRDRVCEVKASAAEALGKLGRGNKDVVPELLPLLSDYHYNNKSAARSAAKALGMLGPEGILPLIEMIRDADPRRQWEAIEAVADIGAPARDAAPELVAVLKDEGRPVYMRMSAARALGRMVPPPDGAVHALAAALKSDDVSLCMIAAEALGELGPAAKDAVPALISVSNDSAAAIEALGRIGPGAKDAIPALAEIVEGRNDEHSALATAALGRIGADAVPALISALWTERGSERRIRAEDALEMGREAVPALVAAMKASAPPFPKDAGYFRFVEGVEGLLDELKAAVERPMTRSEQSCLARWLPPEVRSELFGYKMAKLEARIEAVVRMMVEGFARTLKLGKIDFMIVEQDSLGLYYGEADVPFASMGPSLRWELRPMRNTISINKGMNPVEAQAMLRMLDFIVPHEFGHALQEKRRIPNPSVPMEPVPSLEMDDVKHEANEVMIEAEALDSFVEFASMMLERERGKISRLTDSFRARMIAGLTELAGRGHARQSTAERIGPLTDEYWKSATEGKEDGLAVAFEALVAEYRKIFRSAVEQKL